MAQTTVDDGSIIRVLVAYTSSAKSAEEGSGGTISGLIQLAIDETNQSYANSQISPRVVLAYSYQVSYTEVDYTTDLNRFVGTSDGYMDEVHTFRSEYTADMNVLIFNNSTYCGAAPVVMASASTAFCVVHYDCATGYYSFGHELGHLQGAHHNPEDVGGTPPFTSYGHGYRRCTSPQFRTVMAYANPSFCNVPRVQYWSNPNVNYEGVPMGTAATHDNHRVLNETAATVDAFSPDDLVLSSGSISSTKTYEAESSIAAQTSYTVQSGGNVTFRAGASVSLKPGFSSVSGSTFHAYTDADLNTPPSLSGQSDYVTLESNPSVPLSADLLPNYPNPFNPSTQFEYRVEQIGFVSLKIYDLLGREVAVLISEEKAPGIYTVVWDAGTMPSGAYFARFVNGGTAVVRQLMLIR